MRLNVIDRLSSILLLLLSYSLLAQAQKTRTTDSLTGEAGTA
jgi:hypothetical protein